MLATKSLNIIKGLIWYRRGTELLKQMAAKGERHDGKGAKLRSQPATVKLADLKITKTQKRAGRSSVVFVGDGQQHVGMARLRRAPAHQILASQLALDARH
jgi:hypothetical protein